ncbi:MAG TPA: tetratricopeptide repeat protein [Chthonomonadales bacterium]|nr:tetratricopeptide repeat protein [Chthonomonadales bacterium]
MIVKNEEKHLAECLQSAKPWFDEMVVIDTGSTDSTAAIAERIGAKVFRFEWCDSFSAARNESLRHAGKEMGWIMWLDADDTLPERTGRAIRAAAANAEKEVVAFIIPVQFVDDGPNSGTRVDHIKLFRNGLGLRFENRIHEQVLPSIRRAGGKVARLDAVVMHTNYDTSIEGQAGKHERDRKLLELDLSDTPEHPFKLFNYGMTEHYAGNHEAAIAWLQRSLAASGNADTHLRKVYALMAGSQWQLGRKEEALQTLEAGLAAVGDDPELDFLSGRLLAEMGRFQEAKAHYLKAAGADISGHLSSIDIGIVGAKAYHNLGSVCRLLGEAEEAKDWFQKALAERPDMLATMLELFDGALASGAMKEAERMIAHARVHASDSVEVEVMAARYAEAVSGLDAALHSIRHSMAKNGHGKALRMTLVRLLLNVGRVEEAMPDLEELDGEGVAEAAYYRGVCASRSGDNAGALAHMERALALNPGHEQTIAQVEGLRKAVAGG